MEYNNSNENTEEISEQKDEIIEMNNIKTDATLNTGTMPEETELKTGKRKKKNMFLIILEWTSVITIALIIALLIRNFVFEPVEVNGRSMQNTLHDKEKLILYKFDYLFSKPKIGDIVVIEIKQGTHDWLPIPDSERLDYIKRVVAVAGDTVDFKNEHLFVNGKISSEENHASTPSEPANIIRYPHKVPENFIFVLGDNRGESKDSRVIGDINISSVRGKAVFRFWPLEKFGSLN